MAAVAVLLLLSVAVRVPHLASPLTEDHSFRQTQTAITVWTFVTEGIELVDYQTPVFGPPWRVPFEFPLFQATAALLVRVGVTNIDVACRITNLFFFYLSALLLYVVSRMHGMSPGAAACCVVAYVWLPFTIFWSRTSMIDYASVAFALAYLYFVSAWVKRQRWIDLVVAVVAGCLLFLVKLTTAPVVAVATAWVAWEALRPAGTGWLNTWRAHRHVAIGLAVAAVVPLAIGGIWTRYADGVRAAQPATQWLAANNLNAWTIGTWAQRATWDNWAVILDRLWESFLPMSYVVFPLAGIWRAIQSPRAGGAFVSSMALGALATIVIFFNLFRVHNYYLMAVSPAVAVVAGFGLHWIIFERLTRDWLRWVVAATVLVLWQWNAYSYTARAFSGSYDRDFYYQVGHAIADVTSPDERIVVEGNDWSPDYLYYAQRKGLMWRGSVVDMPPDSQARLLASDNFTTIVCVNHRSAAARFWAQHRLVRQIGAVTIYKVSK